MKKLFEEFQPASAEDWKARLEKDLKGITFEQLSALDRNDINIHPFYTQSDYNEKTPALKSEANWSICETIVVKDAAMANKEALEALNNGISGLSFIIENDIEPSTLLQDIELPYIYVHFKINNTQSFTEKLAAFIQSKAWNTNELMCFVSEDFICDFMTHGVWKQNFTAESQQFKAFTQQAKDLNTLCIDATPFQNSGANTVYELACTLAQVNEYLNILNESNQLQPINKVHVSMATDTSFYEQIAKLRALRTLLDIVFQTYNISPAVHVHVETSNIYRSPFDSYSNLLRDTLAGMAGVLGGCDSLYIHPFNETLNEVNPFSKRMSRNQQLIFKEESYLDKVADVAAGSYYLETLTEQLAEKAWKQFQAIEAEGGLIVAMEKGAIKSTIENQAQQLIEEYKAGKRILIGVNKFPNANDVPKRNENKNQDSKGIQAILLSNEIL